ncbi:MAG TPA: metallophosphoesterase [Longimicrobiaceae bacterium]|nr:metallophosphoesterase [Longimicrobiaceae bacterium]
MRSLPRSLLPAVLALIAGCGDRAEAPARTAATEPAGETLYGATGAENLRVVPLEVEVQGLPAGWNGIRIAAISDFQLGLWEDNGRVAGEAVRRAVSLRPDLILLLGDYIARGDQFEVLNRVLAPLRGRPVMAILGDRDQMDEEELQGRPDSTAIRIVQTLKQNGVIVLWNERGRLVRGGDTAYIAGVEPYLARRPPWRQAEIFASIPRTGATPILMSHMPAGALAAPDSSYGLVLSGHTFCGRIEVPGTPRLSWVNTEVFPAGPIPGTGRLYRVKGNGLFITCGVGYTFVPVRIGSPPEVALVTLRRPVAGEPEQGPDTSSASIDSLIQVYQRRDTTRRADTTAATSDTTRGGT